MKILVESKVLPWTTPLAKVENVQLFSFQKGVHPAFDVFDRTSPDAFVCRSSLIDGAIIKNLKERPHIRIVLVNDSKAGIDTLNNELGDIYEVFDDSPYCELDACYGAKRDSLLETEVFCPEGSAFPSLPNWKFNKAKIFSSVAIIDHLQFCGVLPPERRFDGYKSCKYALVDESESINATMCGAIPVSDPSLTPWNVFTKEQVLEGLTNYDFSAKVLRQLGKEKEADQLIAMKNWIGANN